MHCLDLILEIIAFLYFYLMRMVEHAIGNVSLAVRQFVFGVGI